MASTIEPADVGLLLGLLALGAASGLVPVLNAEAILTAAAVSRPELWWLASVSITLGQCSAKVLIYLTARDGPRLVGRGALARRLAVRLRQIAGRARRAGPAALRRARPRWDRLLDLLGRPLPGTTVVALSATLGLPPLAIVSALAGAARLRLPLFVGTCVAGRLVRFLAIAWPVAHLLRAAW